CMTIRVREPITLVINIVAPPSEEVSSDMTISFGDLNPVILFNILIHLRLVDLCPSKSNHDSSYHHKGEKICCSTFSFFTLLVLKPIPKACEPQDGQNTEPNQENRQGVKQNEIG